MARSGARPARAAKRGAARRRRRPRSSRGPCRRASGTPIGEWIRSMLRLVVTLDPESLPEPAPTSPTSRSGPTVPRWAQRSAASHRAKSSAWSWVMTSTCVPAGTVPSTSSGTGAWWTWTPARPSARRRGARRPAPAGARVDQVQLEVVAGEDAGQLEPDVARRRRSRPPGRPRSGSSSTVTSPPQHCRPCSVRALSLSASVSGSGSPGGPRAARARAGTRGLLEVAAADGAPRSAGGDDHLGAGLARRVAAHRRRRVTSTPGRRSPRSRSTAASQCTVSLPTRSGRPARSAGAASARAGRAGPGTTPGRPLGDVAAGGEPPPRPARPPRTPPPGSPGDARSTLVPGGPNAATAWRSASRTREGEHERRLADRLGAVDHAVLVGALEQRDVEAPRASRRSSAACRCWRTGVAAGRGRAVGLVPAQLLEGQPADALHEAALDLAEVDQRRERVADVVHDVDAAACRYAPVKPSTSTSVAAAPYAKYLNGVPPCIAGGVPVRVPSVR